MAKMQKRRQAHEMDRLLKTIALIAGSITAGCSPQTPKESADLVIANEPEETFDEEVEVALAQPQPIEVPSYFESGICEFLDWPILTFSTFSSSQMVGGPYPLTTTGSYAQINASEPGLQDNVYDTVIVTIMRDWFVEGDELDHPTTWSSYEERYEYALSQFPFTTERLVSAESRHAPPETFAAHLVKNAHRLSAEDRIRIYPQFENVAAAMHVFQTTNVEETDPRVSRYQPYVQRFSLSYASPRQHEVDPEVMDAIEEIDVSEQPKFRQHAGHLIISLGENPTALAAIALEGDAVSYAECSE